jgi:subtilisin family serine protease
LALLATTPVPTVPLRTAPLQPGTFRPDEVLVLLQPGADDAVAQAIARDFNLQLETSTPSRILKTRLVRYRIPDGRPVPTVSAALLADGRARNAQVNFVYRPSADATQSVLPQYALDVIRISAARSAAPARTMRIAVLDTGIDDSHPDLRASVTDRFDAVGDGRWDVGAHGTGIAGIIAAHGQLKGLMPDATLLSARVFPSGTDAGSEGTTQGVIRGLEWALEQQADVVNMSLEGPQDPMLDTVVAEVVAAGAVIVAAAGNGGPEAPPAYPAAVKGVIAATATDQHDAAFAGANHGSYISVAAPGVDILVAAPGGAYALATGTSQAAAHVSGLVALLKAARPDLDPAAVLDLLTHSAKDLGAPGPDDVFGAGRIDAEAAMEAEGNLRPASQ